MSYGPWAKTLQASAFAPSPSPCACTFLHATARPALKLNHLRHRSAAVRWKHEHLIIIRSAQISVDGDTSTNDTVIGLASGAAGNARITDPSSKEAEQLHAAVTALLQVRVCACVYACVRVCTRACHALQSVCA